MKKKIVIALGATSCAYVHDLAPPAIIYEVPSGTSALKGVGGYGMVQKVLMDHFWSIFSDRREVILDPFSVIIYVDENGLTEDILALKDTFDNVYVIRKRKDCPYEIFTVRREIFDSAASKQSHNL